MRPWMFLSPYALSSLLSCVTAKEWAGALLPAAEQAERGYSSHHTGMKTHFSFNFPWKCDVLSDTLLLLAKTLSDAPSMYGCWKSLCLPYCQYCHCQDKMTGYHQTELAFAHYVTGLLACFASLVDHSILRSHWFAVQQCLFGGSFAFGPYVHQSQSHSR